MKDYWLTVFSPATWKTFLEIDLQFAAYSPVREKEAARIQPGDRLICYITKVSRFAGILEATGNAYLQTSPDVYRDFPVRVPTRSVVRLPAEYALPLSNVFEHLLVFRSSLRAAGWRSYVRSSPRKWPSRDGELLLSALQEEQANPVLRPKTKGPAISNARAMASLGR